VIIGTRCWLLDVLLFLGYIYLKANNYSLEVYMPKKKGKRSAIRLEKALHLDKPTSHGGWPDGHPGGYYDKETPVNVQIANYLRSMGLLDDGERARLSESRLRCLIRKVLNSMDI
jgi:hypothetical protein